MKSGFRALGCLLLFAPILCAAQTSDPFSKLLPDIPTLMYQVEEHQKASEALVKDYLYHSFAVQQSVDGQGRVKKTETEDAEVFYVAGVRINRLIRKNGRELTPEEQHKESQRIDKEITKAKKNPGQDERDVVTVSRFLELGSFGNPRRVLLSGRDTIAVDFTGNPKAKTRNRLEGAIRNTEGTVWVDEQDRSLCKIQGHFFNAFKVGGGLLADIKKGSSFEAEWTKINGEVWLPASASGSGSIRALLLFNFHGTLRVVNSSYRKFHATATILPATRNRIQTEPQNSPQDEEPHSSLPPQ
jgi:hypothetical protein